MNLHNQSIVILREGATLEGVIQTTGSLSFLPLISSQCFLSVEAKRNPEFR